MKFILRIFSLCLICSFLQGQDNLSYHSDNKNISVANYHISDNTHDSTLNNKSNKSLLQFIVTGNYWQNSKSKFGFGYFGLINPQFITFNTVDGWGYRQSLSLNLRKDSTKHFSLNQDIRYAFNRKAFMVESQFIFYYNPERNGKFSIYAESGSSDFNQKNGINQYINSLTTLLLRKNYEKLFDNKSIFSNNTYDIVKGLTLSLNASFRYSKLLENNTDYSFFYRNNRKFTTNIPENIYFGVPQISNNKSFSIETELYFNPQYYSKYINRYNMLVRSQTPLLSLTFKAGIPHFLNSEASYQYIAGGISQQLRLNENSKFFYEMRAGSFLNVNNIFFGDYQHFNTKPLKLVITDFDNSFQLLDYYKYSTSKYFGEGHFRYSSMYMLLKYLPWIRDHYWTENLYVNYLTTHDLKQYTEIGYGLGQLVFLFNIDVFASFENGTFKSASIKLCIGRY